jgi:hypothetical protein
MPAYEAQDVLIENHVTIGASAFPMEAPIAVIAAHGVSVRHNIII